MRRSCLLLLTGGLALVACNNDAVTSASATETGSTTATGTTSTGEAPTTSTGGASSTEGSGSGVMTGTTTSPVTSTDATSTTDVSTTQGCACIPGEMNGCDRNGEQLVCQADCQTFAPEPCPNGQTCTNGACAAELCDPGTVVCEGEDATQECNDRGAFDPPVDCPDEEGCVAGKCVSLCLQAETTPSSIGCSFFAARQDNYEYENVDSLVVGNTSKTKTAKVQLYFTPEGTHVEQAEGGPLDLAPGQTLEFKLSNQPFQKVSGLRKGGVYRVQSTIPIVAYQHSPITAQATNDSSMLLPEHALRQDHVIASYVDSIGGEDRPSYFHVIAIADGTTVEWTPPVNTLGGLGVPAVGAGQNDSVVMDRFDALQVRAPDDGDLSGTIVHSDKPVWVIGAINCTNVPAGVTYCDHIEEQMFPLDYWGKQYIGAHSPTRGAEKHHWRVYGGEDGTTITTDPPQPGTPFMLNKGQWTELVIDNSTSFVFDGDKPFLPVQYLESQDGGAGTGDPAMYQMVPVEQFLDRYAFVTGTGYDTHYAQIIRLAGNPDVMIDGQVVGGYYAVGGYEVADWTIAEGAHLAESAAPFGIINIGYTPVTSYAYPGGLRLAIINPQ